MGTSGPLTNMTRDSKDDGSVHSAFGDDDAREQEAARHSDALKTMKREHANEIESLKQAHRNAVAQHEREMKRLDAEHQGALEEAKTKALQEHDKQAQANQAAAVEREERVRCTTRDRRLRWFSRIDPPKSSQCGWTRRARFDSF